MILVFGISGFAQRADGLSTDRWRPVEINRQKVEIPDGFFQINEARNRFSANAGCNSISGTISSKGAQVRISNVVSTRKFCGGEMTNETNFIRALEQATRYTAAGNRLRFFARNVEVLEFERADTDVPVPVGGGLESRKWVLEAIGGKRIGRIASEAFIVFDPAKFSAGGNTSCNTFGGSYIDKADRVKIYDTISTLRACVEDNRMDVERGFMEGLREADRFVIRNNRLILSHHGKELLEFRGMAK